MHVYLKSLYMRRRCDLSQNCFKPRPSNTTYRHTAQIYRWMASFHARRRSPTRLWQSTMEDRDAANDITHRKSLCCTPCSALFSSVDHGHLLMVMATMNVDARHFTHAFRFLCDCSIMHYEIPQTDYECTQRRFIARL